MSIYETQNYEEGSNANVEVLHRICCDCLNRLFTHRTYNIILEIIFYMLNIIW